MKLLDNELKDQATGSFFNGKDFEAGVVVSIESMVAAPADNEKFGAKEDKNGLKKGENWVYTLKTESGAEKIFKNSSTGLASAIAKLDPEAGTKVKITRSGEGMDTTWEVVLA